MERETIQDALDYCLENPEGLSAEELLSRFPEYREELASLLGLASDLETLTAPAIPAARRAAMKASLMETAAASQAAQAASTAPTEPISTLSAQVADPRPPSTIRSRRPLPWFLSPGWVVAAAALMLIAFIWWSSGSALPDSPFYGVRLASESFTLGLSSSDVDKTRARIGLANNRLYDLRAMQERGKLAQAQAAFDSYSSNLNNSVNMWNGLTGQQHTDVAGLLYASSVAGKVTFQGFKNIESTLPVALQDQIRDTTAALDSAGEAAERSLVAANIDPAGVLGRVGGNIAPLLTPVVPSVIAVPTFTVTGNGQVSPTVVAIAMVPTDTPTVVTETATAAASATAPPVNPSPTVTGTDTPTSPPPTPTMRPPAPSRTPTIVHVRPTPTRRPPTPPHPSPTHTSMPVPSVPPVPHSATPTATPAQPTPDPQPGRSCDLRIRDVSIFCQGGCVGWRATVENRGDTTIDADWTAELQIKPKSAGGFDAVASENGSSSFSPGDSTFEGTICYDFPPDTDKIRVEFYVEGDNCNLPSHKSRDAGPCR